MTPVIIYPVPLDNWDTFKIFAQRFVDTYLMYRPTVEHTLTLLMCNDGKRINYVDFAGVFDRIPPFNFIGYNGPGFDIGAQLYASAFLPKESFMINLTSRCYFHRPGWLKALMDARIRGGPGLYGCSASHGGGKLHLCTRGWCMDAADIARLPFQVTTKEQGLDFEQNLIAHANALGRPSRLVYFSGVYNIQDWFRPANIYGNGDQSNVLIWDKHTDIYRDADKQLKDELSSHIYGYKIES